MDKEKAGKANDPGSDARIALFGGSFDPVHCAHLEVARRAMEQAKLTRIIFLPASQAPLKQKPFFDNAARLNMLRLALQEAAGFELDTYEIEQDKINYSIDTVDHFKKKYGGASLFWIIGEDQFHQLGKWHRIDELVTKVKFLVYPRGSKEISQKPFPDCNYQMLKAKKLPASSTNIRKRFNNDQSINGFIPDAVKAFIYKKDRHYEGLQKIP